MDKTAKFTILQSVDHSIANTRNEIEKIMLSNDHGKVERLLELMPDYVSYDTPCDAVQRAIEREWKKVLQCREIIAKLKTIDSH